MARYSMSPPPNEVLILSDDEDVEELDEEDDIIIGLEGNGPIPDELLDLDEDLRDDDVVYLGTRTHSPTPATRQYLDVAWIPGNGLEVRPNTGWQLFESPETPTPDFFFVLRMRRNTSTSRAKAEGIRLRRAFHCSRFVPKTLNELCAIIKASEDVANPALDIYTETIELSELSHLREIIFTNFPFQRTKSDEARFRFDHSFRDAIVKEPWNGPAHTWEHDVLVCRSKFVLHSQHKDGRVTGGAIISLRGEEATKGKGLSDVEKRLQFRDEKLPDQPPQRPGAQSARNPETPPSQKRKAAEMIDLTSDDEQNVIDVEAITTGTKRIRIGGKSFYRPEQHRITKRLSVPKTDPLQESDTYADIFCGGGGACRGASDAGFRPAFMVDMDATACKTVKLNWPKAQVYEDGVNEFIAKLKATSGMKVKFLHFSPPCKAFSPLNRGGKNDQVNRDCTLVVDPLITVCQPRVVTVEQTFGILHTKNYEYFQALIHQFTMKGYSVRWRQLDCACYENCQHRKRLFLIASCPGEPLPPYPEPTNGLDAGLQPFVTVNDRLRLVPKNLPAHLRQYTPKEHHVRTDGNQCLRHCVTCDGGQSDSHPTEPRTFNIGELASIAGFPSYHKWPEVGKTKLREMCGNAVPPVVYEKIALECKKSMKEFDRKVRAHKRDIIELEGLDDD